MIHRWRERKRRRAILAADPGALGDMSLDRKKAHAAVLLAGSSDKAVFGLQREMQKEHVNNGESAADALTERPQTPQTPPLSLHRELDALREMLRHYQARSSASAGVQHAPDGHASRRRSRSAPNSKGAASADRALRV